MMKLSMPFCLTALWLLGDMVAGVRVNPRQHSRLSLLAKGTSETNHTRSRSKLMSELYPFYHTTEKIQSELQALAKNCPAMSIKTVSATTETGEQSSIDVVTIRQPDSNPVNRNFLLFGEHARELISPESGLHLVKSLCGQTDLTDQAREVLKDSEFQIVVNGNPESRKKVETGDYCLRVNPDGVDLNRNWDEKWQPVATLDTKDTNPGPKAFSEAETRLFKQLVEEYRPTNFLTIHSGTRGMYMPWAYDMEHLATRNQPQMMQILKTLDKDHCECPFGAAGKEVGYSCPGTCLDWVYDQLQTPYAFAFEIYVGDDSGLKDRWQELMSDSEDGFLLQTNNHLAHPHFKDFFAKHPSSFVQVHSKKRRRGGEECFSQFNPESEAEYRKTVENWSGAYMQMAQLVAANLKNGTAIPAGPI